MIFWSDLPPETSDSILESLSRQAVPNGGFLITTFRLVSKGFREAIDRLALRLKLSPEICPRTPEHMRTFMDRFSNAREISVLDCYVYAPTGSRLLYNMEGRGNPMSSNALESLNPIKLRTLSILNTGGREWSPKPATARYDYLTKLGEFTALTELNLRRESILHPSHSRVHMCTCVVVSVYARHDYIPSVAFMHDNIVRHPRVFVLYLIAYRLPRPRR